MTGGSTRRLLAVLVLILCVDARSAFAASTDFNADGHEDVVWRNQLSGDVAIWLMNGAAVLQGPVVSPGVPLTWQIVGIGDFNADGRSDLLWRNTAGDVAIWLMNGVAILQSAAVSNVPLAWQMAAVGDLNGDGRDDLVWRNTQNGDVAAWLMNGAAVLQGPVISLGSPLAWQIVGTADLDGNGRSDLIWRHTQSGDVAAWLMNGVVVAHSVGIGNVPGVWQIVGLADLDADGRDDLVWRHVQNGNAAVWLMNGAAVTAAPVIAFAVPLAWQIAAMLDVNADGRGDAVWRNAETGDVAVWLMDGATVLQQPVIASGLPLSWRIQANRPVPISVAPPPPTQFGPGVYLVGRDIAPGRYYADPAVGCYWERLSGLGGTTSEILANDFVAFNSAQSVVDILPSDLAFSTDADCGIWFSTPRHGPQASIPPGSWLVGAQVAPGTYSATVQAGCYWERVTNFTNNLSSIIANNFIPTASLQYVAIAPGDVGFKTDGDCGVWTRVVAAMIPSEQSIEDISGHHARHQQSLRGLEH